MANSVGSVSIDLEARIAKFESDMGRAARIAEQRSREMRRTLGAVAGALGAGISIVGFERWIRGAINAQDEISKMAQKTAVSTEALSGWNLLAKQAGVSTQGLATGLAKLGQSAALASEGGKLQANAFKSIGVSAIDANGHLKNTEALFGEVAEKISKYKDSTEKTVIAMRLFGKAGADLVPMLNAGAEGLAEYVKMADDFGLTVSGKTAKAAERFNDSVAQLGLVSKGVANQIAGSLAPALSDLSDKAVAFFRSGDWKRILDDISTGAKYVADHIGDIITAVKTLGEVVATVYSAKLLKSGIEWIGNLNAQSFAVDALGKKTALSLGASIKNVGLLATGVNLLGAAVVGWQIGKYLRDNFLEARLAGIAFVDGTLVAWERMKQGAAIAWEGIKAAAIGAMNDIRIGLAGLASFEADIVRHIPVTGTAAAAALDDLAKKMRPASSAADGFKASVAGINATANANIAAIHKTTDEMADYEIAQEAAKNATAKHIPIIAGLGKTLTIAGDAAADAAKKQAAAMQALYDGLQKIKEAGNPSEQAYSQFAETVRGMAKLGAAAIKAGADVATVQAVVADAVSEANKKLALELGKPMIAAQEYADALDDQLTARKRLITAQVATMSMGTQEAANYRELIGVTQEAADAVAKLQRQHELHPEAFGPGQYEAEIAKTKQFYEDLKQATIGGQEAISAAQADWHVGVNKAVNDFLEQQRNKAAQAQEFTSSFIGGFGDAFAQFASDAESAKDAFGSFIDSMYQQALKFIANKAIQAIFDSFGGGSTQTAGTTAGGWGSLIGNFASYFSSSGGRASGGPVDAGKFYQVNERGPEIFTYNNADYLMAGRGGKVTPITAAPSNHGGGNTFVTNVNVQPTSTRRTADQVAQEVARKQRIASTRAA